MMFVSYCLALAILAVAYEWPDLVLLVGMVFATRFVLRHF